MTRNEKRLRGAVLVCQLQEAIDNIQKAIEGDQAAMAWIRRETDGNQRLTFGGYRLGSIVESLGYADTPEETEETEETEEIEE